MAAMLWFGGGVMVHGLYELGWPALEYAVRGAASALGPAVPGLGAAVRGMVGAAIHAGIGLAAGAASDRPGVIAPFIGRRVSRH